MPIPRTDDDVARILHRIANPTFFDARTLVVEFTTSEDTARRVLPPGFEPVDGLRCWTRVGIWRSDCVGDFGGSTTAIEARFGDHVGFLSIAMYMDSEPAILFGRELYGEPKRGARSALEPTAAGWSAHVERHGVRIVELQATAVEELGPVEAAGVGFNIKSTFAPDGSGLLGDAVVTRTDVAGEFDRVVRCDGALTLASSPHDPLGELDVVQVTGAAFSAGGFRPRARAIGTIPGAAFLPYALARVDDYSLLVSPR